MDFNTILNWLGIALMGAGGTWACVEAVKHIKFIPIDAGMTLALRATAAFFSALLVVGLGYLDGKINPEDLRSLLAALIAMVSAWIGAHALHKAGKALAPQEQ